MASSSGPRSRRQATRSQASQPTGHPVDAAIRLKWEEIDRHRVWTLLAVAGLLAGLVLAVAGLPPVDLHGPLHRLGIMDPLCGATRGVRLMLRGDLAGAWRYNPAAPPLVAGAVLAALRAGVGMVTGRWLTLQLRWTRRYLVVAGLLVAVLWVNQQAHAAMLLGRV
jgi:hypothetical protein